MDSYYLYLLALHCPLASGYFYKNKRIAAVFMVVRVYSYIKVSLISPHHQSGESRLLLQLKLYY